METLRFLMISTYYPPAHLGGDAKFVEYLSVELARRGHEVHILQSPAAYLLQRDLLPPLGDVAKDGVFRHIYMAGPGRIDPMIALIMGEGTCARKEFERLASRLKPDVIHWHNTKGFLGCPMVAAEKTTLYTAHDFYAVCPRSSLLRPGFRICTTPILCQVCLLGWKKPPQLWRSLGNRVMRLPERLKVISPSNFLANRLAEDGIRVDHVLPNFVPRMKIASADTGVPMRLIYLGVLERHKGLFTLVNAFHQCRSLQDFRLSIFGEGSIKMRLKRMIDALGLENRATVHGFVPLEELSSILSETVAVIVPSESYENAPLAALEALSMGLPVIGSNLGGLPEILQPDAGCLLFEPGDATQLANEIVALWQDRENLPRRAAMAKSVYDARYSPEVHIPAYMKMLRKTAT